MAEQRDSHLVPVATLVFTVFSVFIGAYLYFLGWLKLHFYFFYFGIPTEQIDIPIQSVLVHSYPVLEALAKNLTVILTNNLLETFMFIVIVFLYYFYGFKNRIITTITVILIIGHIAFGAWSMFSEGRSKAKKMGEVWAVDKRLAQQEEVKITFTSEFLKQIDDGTEQLLKNKILTILFATKNQIYVLAETHLKDLKNCKTLKSLPEDDCLILADHGRLYSFKTKDILFWRKRVNDVRQIGSVIQ